MIWHPSFSRSKHHGALAEADVSGDILAGMTGKDHFHDPALPQSEFADPPGRRRHVAVGVDSSGKEVRQLSSFQSLPAAPLTPYVAHSVFLIGSPTLAGLGPPHRRERWAVINQRSMNHLWAPNLDPMG